jgi:hypothetical protein
MKYKFECYKCGVDVDNFIFDQLTYSFRCKCGEEYAADYIFDLDINSRKTLLASRIKIILPKKN